MAANLTTSSGNSVIGIHATYTNAANVPRTLIADDDADILVALCLLLKTEGYEAETASSPAAALEAIEQSHFDVVLMDLNYARDTTSGQEGIDLISRIQAIDPFLPIVVMTAWGTVDLAVEAMRHGVRDFVQKPWENQRLLKILDKQVKHGRARRTVQLRAAETGRTATQLRLELSEARELQENLLSKTMPELKGFQFAAQWLPAATIGGDYVGAFPITDDHVALCVADVVGKGLPAALLMSNFQAALKSFALEDFSSAGVAKRLNRVLCANTPLHKFVTAFYGVLNVMDRTLVYTNCGHNPPLLMHRNGDCGRLETGGTVLGVFDDFLFQENKVQLAYGDRLLLFTDGLTEAMNESKDQFGEERLVELLSQNRHLGAEELKEIVLTTAGEFCDHRFQDDAALMIVEID
jgi:sigma-B regulation protein RsbU (phosphoserine phosphatase)